MAVEILLFKEDMHLELDIPAMLVQGSVTRWAFCQAVRKSVLDTVTRSEKNPKLVSRILCFSGCFARNT